MGFGKLIKDVAKGISEINEERRERKYREKVRDFERKENIAAGRFCKGCGRTGEFDNKCNDCLKFPFCENCCRQNKRYGTICLNCCPKYLCNAQSCNNLSDDDCVACGRQVCQDHWEVLFVEKNQFFSCVFDKGNVCTFCVAQGKTGTFRKRFNCPKCRNELHQKTIH